VLDFANEAMQCMRHANSYWSLSKVKQKIRKNKIHRMVRWTQRVAACTALLIVSSLMFILPHIRSARQNLSGVEAIVGQVMQSNDIQLITGEKVVELKQNALITVNDGQISVAEEESNISEILLSENVMHKLIVPPGKRSTLQLSDGTKMWLNSSTELDFPSKFTGNTREITVKGEIYIEVAEGQKPFYVNTSQFRVRVHGTKFNISAYGEDEENSVVLVEGSVEIATADHKPIMLTPSEKVAVSAGEIQKATVNVAEYIGWKDGVLIFDQTPISEVLKKIGRYYNVCFEDRSGKELFAKTCTGELFLSEDFEEMMLCVATLSATQYEKEDDIIYLK